MGGNPELRNDGQGHHGHILSLVVKSRPSPCNGTGRENDGQERLAIVGDLMRSISVIRHEPNHNYLEEVARDYNPNWTTAVEMLTNNVYIGAENFHNLFLLRRNHSADSEERRSRLDTTGLFHLGEMPNKFLSGGLIMPGDMGGGSGGRSPSGSSLVASPITVGSQTLYATVDGTIGTVLGLDVANATFFSAVEKSMARVIPPVADLKHNEYRCFQDGSTSKPSRGFIDGDLVEEFLELDRTTMEKVVHDMEQNGKWYVDDLGWDNGRRVNQSINKSQLMVDNVLAAVEEMSMMH